ncbi:hypothetical protein CDIK_4592, partial [Cucumispora dikerogammari]
IVGYQIQDGVYNGDLFISYLNPRIVPYFIANPSFVLIIDNCRFYYRLDVKRFLIEKSINFKFLPPYLLHLNLIKECFSVIKSRYKNLRLFSKTRERFKIKIRQVLDTFTIELNFIFQHARSYKDIAISRQPFI